MRTAKTIISGFLLLLSACQATPEYPKTLEMTTWSVAAIDPVTGDVGVVSASCVPSFADALGALVPGMGAAATQADEIGRASCRERV